MTNLNTYLTDGMNWQSQMILTYLRGHYDYALEESFKEDTNDYSAQLLVKQYENGREKGYVVSLRYNYKMQKNYAFFEHCVSDHICLMMDNTLTADPNGWGDREWSKYTHDKEFDHEQVMECARFILDDIRKTLHGWKSEECGYGARKRWLVHTLENAIAIHGGYCFNEGEKAFYPIYCSEPREESIAELYVTDEGDVVVTTFYKDEDGQTCIEHTLVNDFSNEEIETIFDLIGLAR